MQHAIGPRAPRQRSSYALGEDLLARYPARRALSSSVQKATQEPLPRPRIRRMLLSYTRSDPDTGCGISQLLTTACDVLLSPCRVGHKLACQIDIALPIVLLFCSEGLILKFGVVA